jgi:hypothetical protein
MIGVGILTPGGPPGTIFPRAPPASEFHRPFGKGGMAAHEDRHIGPQAQSPAHLPRDRSPRWLSATSTVAALDEPPPRPPIGRRLSILISAPAPPAGGRFRWRHASADARRERSDSPRPARRPPASAGAVDRQFAVRWSRYRHSRETETASAGYGNHRPAGR